MKASTHHRLAPTLKDKVPDSFVPDGVKSIYEIVICGLSEEVIAEAMKRGILAAAHAQGIIEISAGNYGESLDRSSSTYMRYLAITLIQNNRCGLRCR